MKELYRLAFGNLANKPSVYSLSQCVLFCYLHYAASPALKKAFHLRTSTLIHISDKFHIQLIKI